MEACLVCNGLGHVDVDGGGDGTCPACVAVAIAREPYTTPTLRSLEKPQSAGQAPSDDNATDTGHELGDVSPGSGAAPVKGQDDVPGDKDRTRHPKGPKHKP